MWWLQLVLMIIGQTALATYLAFGSQKYSRLRRLLAATALFFVSLAVGALYINSQPAASLPELNRLLGLYQYLQLLSSGVWLPLCFAYQKQFEPQLLSRQTRRWMMAYVVGSLGLMMAANALYGQCMIYVREGDELFIIVDPARAQWNRIQLINSVVLLCQYVFVLGLIARHSRSRIRRRWFRVLTAFDGLTILLILVVFLFPSARMSPAEYYQFIQFTLFSFVLHAWALTDFTLLDFSARNNVRSIMNAMTNWVVLTDGKFRIREVNPAFARHTGFSPEQLRGRSLSELATVFDSEHPVTLDDVVQRTRSFDGTVQIGRTFHYVHINIEPVPLNNQRMRGYVLLFTDLTTTENYRQQKASLQQYNHELTQINEDLRMILFIASHDLKTPLVTIRQFTRLLKQSVDERTREYAQFIDDCTAQLRQISERVVAVVKSRSTESDHSLTDLRQILTDVRLRLHGIIEESGADIRYLTELPTVTGDALLLTELFQNLIENAIKYNRAGTPPLIEVHCYRQDDELHFEIRDNGIGFHSYGEQRFDQFERLANRQPGNSGIGLALSTRIVEKYGGRLWVTPNTPAGAIVHFTWPLAEETEELLVRR